MEERTGNKIEELIDSKDGFTDLHFIEQVKYLAYFYVKATGNKSFLPQDIKEVFDVVSLESPRNVSDLCNKLHDKGVFVKNNSFGINRKVFKELETEFSLNERTELELFYISGDKPWSDRNKHLIEFLKGVRGEVSVLEKHYGMGTFHVLESFPKDAKIKFLTAELGGSENPDKVMKELKRFKKEFPNIQFKKYPKPHELHDRYIISDNLLVWVGHGIKDFGDNECFLIGITRKRVPEIVNVLEKKFKDRWSRSDNL